MQDIFLYTKQYIILTDIQENNYICRIWKKRIKVLGIDLTREVKKCVHWKSPKVAKETEKTNKMKSVLFLCVGKLNIVKMTVLLQANYRRNEMSIITKMIVFR